MKRLYVIVREDLNSPNTHQTDGGFKAAQACHAVAELIGKFQTDKRWDKYMILLGVPDKGTLLDWADFRLLKKKVHEYVVFYEPDIGNEPTSIAFFAEPKKIRGLELLKL